MATFKYTYADSTGKKREGMMMGTSAASLESKLSNLGYWILDIKEVEMRGANPTKPGFFTPKVKRRDLIDFCFQLKTQIEAGVPLVDAIASLPKELSNPYLKAIMREVHEDLETGFQFQEALARHPLVFTEDITSLIEAGVNSGELPNALSEAREHLEWADRLVAQVRQASIYPLFVAIAIGLFMLTVFTLVVPKFVKLFEKLNMEAPFVTQMVFGASDLAKSTWWMWLLGGIAVPLLIRIAAKKSSAVAYKIDQIKLKTPVFGELQTMIALSRFAHNLASLLRSGVPIIRTIQLCQGMVGNRVVATALGDVERELEKGQQMSEVLERHPIFNSLVIRMVKIGERTGQIDTALESVSNYYEEVVPRQVKSIFSMVEPALILFLVGIVGTVAMAIFLPIFDLMKMTA